MLAAASISHGWPHIHLTSHLSLIITCPALYLALYPASPNHRLTSLFLKGTSLSANPVSDAEILAAHDIRL
jgi:hypothetical protein